MSGRSPCRRWLRADRRRSQAVAAWELESLPRQLPLEMQRAMLRQQAMLTPPRWERDLRLVREGGRLPRPSSTLSLPPWRETTVFSIISAYCFCFRLLGLGWQRSGLLARSLTRSCYDAGSRWFGIDRGSPRCDGFPVGIRQWAGSSDERLGSLEFLEGNRAGFR